MQSNEVEPDTPQPPKNKGGRPPGRKNRPRWLLNEIKKLPKRGKGRPKGSKNKPKTLEEILAAEITRDRRGELIATKAVEPKPKKPKGPKVVYKPGTIPAHKRPEVMAKLQAGAARSIRLKLRPPKSIASMPTNVPRRDQVAALVEAEKEAKRILKIMEKEGLIPDDHMAKAALQATFEMVTGPLPPRERLAAARTILEYTKQKPTTTTNLNIKTAEDFLDELAADDDN